MEDYEAQILELRTTLKEFKNLLAKEQLERERERRFTKAFCASNSTLDELANKLRI